MDGTPPCNQMISDANFFEDTPVDLKVGLESILPFPSPGGCDHPHRGRFIDARLCGLENQMPFGTCGSHFDAEQARNSRRILHSPDRCFFVFRRHADRTHSRAPRSPCTEIAYAGGKGPRETGQDQDGPAGLLLASERSSPMADMFPVTENSARVSRDFSACTPLYHQCP